MIGLQTNNMNEIERQKRIDFLKSAYRLTWSENDEGGVNRTHGLFMLAKDLIKPDFILGSQQLISLMTSLYQCDASI